MEPGNRDAGSGRGGLNAAANRGGNAGDVGRFRVAGDERRVERKRSQLGAVVSPSGERVELIFKGPTQKHLVAKRVFHRRNSGSGRRTERGKKRGIGETGGNGRIGRRGVAEPFFRRLAAHININDKIGSRRRRTATRTESTRRSRGALRRPRRAFLSRQNRFNRRKRNYFANLSWILR